MYFPIWFEIKHYSKLAHGSKNFFNLSQGIVSFPNQKVVEIALKVLQNNGFFAHQENILLGMLGDEDKDLQRMAVNKLYSLRLKGPNYPNENDNFEGGFAEPSLVSTECTATRKFSIPKINFRAKSFHKMVNLNLPDIHEPPATKQFSYKEINEFRLQPLKLDHPGHNQVVERHVKLVTEASASTAGHGRRDQAENSIQETNKVFSNKETIQSLKTLKSFLIELSTHFN